MNDFLLGSTLMIYMLLFVGFSMAWRSCVVWRRTGINPYRLGSSDSTHDFVGRLFRLVLVGFAAIILVFTFWPDAYALLEIRGLPRHPWMQSTGGLLLILSLFFVLIAQAHMGSAWRIGIDKENTTALVRRGLYRFSRNPIFLGMRVCSLGLFFVLPNAATLLSFVLGDLLIQIQVRLEEEHLRTLHKESYDEYCTITRRWFGIMSQKK